MSVKYDIGLLVELAAAALASRPGAAPGLAVVVQKAHRTHPLLEAAGATAYVQLRPVLHQDFHLTPGGQPVLKGRVAAAGDPESAADLVSRASLLVMQVPDEAAAVAAMPELEAAGRLCLFHGPARAAGWARLSRQVRGAELTPIEVSGARLLISREAVDLLGGRQMLMPHGLPDLAARVARQLPQHLQVELLHPGQGVRLRMRIDPLQLVAAGTDTLAHNITKEGRALFNTRGLGALTLPVDGRGSLQLLVRNVRDRIDHLTVAVGDAVVPVQRIDYTEFGAVLTLPPTPVAADRDALMFLSLPPRAVPRDGFCDVGGVTQTLDLA